MEDFIALAKGQLGRIKALCSQVGLKYIELPDHFMGAGIGAGFGETDYVVLSVIAGGGESKLMITSGVLKSIRRDRLAALDACNSLTRENTIFPVFLHDAEAGWDVLIQLTYPIDLLVDNPSFFDVIVRTVPQVADKHRGEFAEKTDVGGQPWRWNAEDLGLLLTKSIL
jgi:hypothetical protein